MSGGCESAPRHWFRIVLSAVVVGLFALPLYVAVVNVFKTNDQIMRAPLALPDPFSMENLLDGMTRSDNLLWTGFFNSLVIAVSTVVLVVPVAAVVAYWIVRRKSRFTRIALLVLMAGMMIPPHIVLLPAVRVLEFLGIAFTFPGVILFNISGGFLSFGVFVYVGFMSALPPSLDDAAAIDGASPLQTLRHVVFPLLRPATATVAIFVGLWSWNDLITPLFLLGPAQGVTITTGVYIALGQYNNDFGQMFGVMFIAALPILIYYLLLQKQFTSGLLSGSTKG
ncbi:MAG: carbohydrate ABC transporter permease [Chloroflexota bacterium]|nr:carbohydrate ABC transporter permease [Chloroflexota bacterium]